LPASGPRLPAIGRAPAPPGKRCQRREGGDHPQEQGLEYPIVFCPFNWAKSKIDPKKSFSFHDEADDWKLNLVLDPEGNPHRASAEREELAENMRLLYVSLTRAKHRCYLVWAVPDAETSSLSYILHPPGCFGKRCGGTGTTSRRWRMRPSCRTWKELPESQREIFYWQICQDPEKRCPRQSKEEDLAAEHFPGRFPATGRLRASRA